MNHKSKNPANRRLLAFLVPLKGVPLKSGICICCRFMVAVFPVSDVPATRFVVHLAKEIRGIAEGRG